MNPKRTQKLDLFKTLVATIELTSRSQESDWSSTSPEMAVSELRSAVDRLFSRSETKASDINYLFGPTGPLQEIAIANGWHDEYLVLAEEWDGCKEQMA